MATASPGPARPSLVKPRRRRTGLVILVLAGAALAVGLAWHTWHRSQGPAPPEIALADADPAVAQAVAAARAQVLRSPHDASAWADLGQILRATDSLSQAATCFDHAARLSPAEPRWPYLEGEALLLHGMPEAALPALRRAAQLCDEEGMDVLAPRLRLAEALLAGGRYEEAEAELGQARQAEPDHPSIHLDLAQLAYVRGDLKASRAHLLRCRHSPFTQKRACVQLAVLEQRLGNSVAAQRLERQAAALPHDLHWSDPWVLECLRRAPGKPGRFRYVEQLEAQGRLADAVAQLQQIVADDPDPQAYVGLGRDLLELRDFGGAEHALRAALSRSPDNVQAHYYLAKMRWAQAEQAWARGDRDGAREMFRAAADSARRALVRKPDHALAHMILGQCLERLGQRDAALAALGQAVACAPELAEPSLHLGEALAAAGRPAEARTHLENALRLARPDDARPRAALARLSTTGKKPR